ncbi:F-box family protein [Klebsormidium nitens]|uniref:F-box family protein n=1 Tax=Klebsormidium nitens TaxID=105231 RepID=A0A1Y1ICD7_KLENI|nr:F-box family protein [Klebsormidium nitens]|eukprot:GAQ87632.1 F-box family protein [Klebsormidium nitens]
MQSAERTRVFSTSLLVRRSRTETLQKEADRHVVAPMARTKQTARKCSGGGSRFRRSPPPLVASDSRPTGKAYLEVLRQLEQSQSPVSSEHVTGVVAGVIEQSVSDARTALPDLGPDLLQRIFAKVGPHPKDLVPLGAVSKEWRQVLNESTWKELCLEHAGGLIEELGYSNKADGPLGGWAGLYKVLVYCPGCHLPTFEPVLQAEALREDYNWTHGRGHVEAAPKGFCKGKEAKEALYLATSDEVVISRLCSHRQAVEMCDADEASAPPILACRGFVKSFESSKLAQMSGAAAFLSKSIEAAGAASGPAESPRKGSDLEGAAITSNVEGMVDKEDLDEEDSNAFDIDDSEEYSFGDEDEGRSEGEASSDLEEAKELGPPCLYCSSPIFALPRKAFDPLSHVDYDELLSESFCDAYDRHEDGDDSEEDERDDTKFVLASGFVCLSGHIVLGMAGYPKLVALGVPHSGEALKLPRPQAIEFLLKFLVGKRGPESPVGIVDVLEAKVPASLLEVVQDFVLTGSPGFVECERSIFDAFEAVDRKEEEAMACRNRRQVVDEALRGAGVGYPLWQNLPKDLSNTLKAHVETGNPSLAECNSLILEERETIKQEEERTRALELRMKTISEALRQAGFDSQYHLVPHQQSLRAYIDDPGSITVEEVVAQQRDVRVQSGNCIGVTDGRLCGNKAALACSNKRCGNCCRKLVEPCRTAKHRKS